MNHTYKMKYASYLETLTQEQRNAELISSVTKGIKRSAGKKLDEQVDFPNTTIPFFPFSLIYLFFLGGRKEIESRSKS